LCKSFLKKVNSDRSKDNNNNNNSNNNNNHCMFSTMNLWPHSNLAIWNGDFGVAGAQSRYFCDQNVKLNVHFCVFNCFLFFSAKKHISKVMTVGQ
jgi:hypothetical protein